MFLGHVPAGYLCTKLFASFLQRKPSHGIGEGKLLLIGMAAAQLPDIDLFYFYLIDARQHVHHTYWTHIPIYWAGIFLVAAALARVSRNAAAEACCALIGINVFLHLLLDTIVGKIYWFYPFSSRSFALFQVSFVYSWWVWNFILHWTFLFEIAVMLAAALVFLRSRNGKSVATAINCSGDHAAGLQEWGMDPGKVVPGRQARGQSSAGRASRVPPRETQEY